MGPILRPAAAARVRILAPAASSGCWRAVVRSPRCWGGGRLEIMCCTGVLLLLLAERLAGEKAGDWNCWGPSGARCENVPAARCCCCCCGCCLCCCLGGGGGCGGPKPMLPDAAGSSAAVGPRGDAPGTPAAAAANPAGNAPPPPPPPPPPPG